MSKAWYIVAYDIRDSKRLQRVAKLMKGYGTRMQYSVFRCYLGDRELEKLRWESAKIITGEDDIQFVGLCKSCIGRMRKRGGQDSWPDDPPTFEIV